MSDRFKSKTLLTTLAVLSLAIVADANAGSERNERVTNKQIQTCISEIGLHADYGNASRVVHWVATLDQKNFWEMDIEVRTSVYAENEDDVIREYKASCVTVTTGNLRRFRIAAA